MEIRDMHLRGWAVCDVGLGLGCMVGMGISLVFSVLYCI